VNEFGEPSSKLEFDRFDDDVVVDEGEPEGQPAAGMNGWKTEEDGEKGDKLEPKSRTKPPTADEYQWQWKVCNLGSNFLLWYTNHLPKPQLETTRRTFFL
jgi:hypothetical protein